MLRLFFPSQAHRKKIIKKTAKERVDRLWKQEVSSKTCFGPK